MNSVKTDETLLFRPKIYIILQEEFEGGWSIEAIKYSGRHFASRAPISEERRGACHGTTIQIR
jgi:hypothetical protein